MTGQGHLSQGHPLGPQLRPICLLFGSRDIKKGIYTHQAWGIRGWNPDPAPPGEPVNLDPKILPCTQLCRAGQGAWLRSFSGKSEGEGRDGEADLGL